MPRGKYDRTPFRRETRDQLRVVDQRALAPATVRQEKSRRERTKEIVPQRSRVVIDAIRHCEQFANTTTYDFREAEKDALVNLFHQTVDELAYALKNPGKKALPIDIFED